MTQNTVPLPNPKLRIPLDPDAYGPLARYEYGYTADQMHAYAAKVCAEKDAEIDKLKLHIQHIGTLLAAINMQLGNGFIPWEIEDAYAEYESALKESK